MKAPGKPQFQAPVPVDHMSGASPMAHAVGRLGHAANKASALAADMQKEQEQQWLTEAELVMRDEDVKIQQYLIENRFDPSKHVGKAQEMYTSAMSRIINKDVYTPGFRQQMDQRLKLYSRSKLDKIATDAKLMQIENGKRIFGMALQQDLEDHNYDGARQRIQDGAGTYFNAGELPHRLKKIDKAEETEEMVGDILRSPEEELQKMENRQGRYSEDNMSEYDLRVRKDEAHRAIAQNERNLKAGIYNLIDEGIIDTPSELAEHLEGEQYKHLSEKRKKNMVDGFARKGQVRMTEDELRKFTTEIDRLGRDVDRGKIDYGSKEHYERWKKIDDGLDSLPPQDRRGEWMSRMATIDPLRLPADGDDVYPTKVLKSDYASTGKDKILDMFDDGKFGRIYLDPEKEMRVDKNTGEYIGEGWTPGPKHLEYRLQMNSAAEKKMDEERRMFLLWLERNKDTMTEEKYDKYFEDLKTRLIPETE